MIVRKSTIFGFVLLILFIFFVGTFIEAGKKDFSRSQSAVISVQWVKKLGLTDPALFTEAVYIRHLSQADRHAPFQDHPTSMEHFLGGALIQPPAHLRL